MSRDDLHHAAELLDRLAPQSTPGPWRDSSVDGNRYAALVADTCIRRCDQWATRYGDTPPGWMAHPHDGYGGCLVAESQSTPDRRLMAVLRNVTEAIPPLLRAVAEENPAAVGEYAHIIANAITDTPQTERPTQ